jgi:hypothetical protein
MEVGIFSPIITYKELLCSRNLTYTGFDIQYFIKNLLIASFFKIVVQHICFVKGRGTSGSRDRNFKIHASFSEVPQIFPQLALVSTLERSGRPVFTKCSDPRDLW